MLEYSLHPNPLTEREDDYTAAVHPKVSYSKEEVIDLMLQRGTLMTRTDALAVINNLEETVAYIVANGGVVNMPLFSTGFSVSGLFNGALDVFDGTRHRLNVTVRDGVLLRRAQKKVELHKVNTASPQPQILEVKDSLSGTVDRLLTAGGPVEIMGINIKVAGDDPSSGIFFVGPDGVETRALTVITNKPSVVMVVAPMLSEGADYLVKVVTQFSAGGRTLQNSKVTVFPTPLICVYRTHSSS
ncbi:MAG: DUF4469 domain-containing protein [Tannerellaceae bacterium]|nr:DUF4469 domain-containing protein [Tannerellaceae bacterium]